MGDSDCKKDFSKYEVNVKCSQNYSNKGTKNDIGCSMAIFCCFVGVKNNFSCCYKKGRKRPGLC